MRMECLFIVLILQYSKEIQSSDSIQEVSKTRTMLMINITAISVSLSEPLILWLELNLALRIVRLPMFNTILLIRKQTLLKQQLSSTRAKEIKLISGILDRMKKLQVTSSCLSTNLSTISSSIRVSTLTELALLLPKMLVMTLNIKLDLFQLVPQCKFSHHCAVLFQEIILLPFLTGMVMLLCLLTEMNGFSIWLLKILAG